MFTGIIESLGRLIRVDGRPQGRVFEVAHAFEAADLSPGESIAHNGVCLTVVTCDQNRFTVEMSQETLDRTTLGSLTVGDEVHLERAMRFGDRLGGHLISGHVDGVGQLKSIVPQGESRVYTITMPEALRPYVVMKGSVAIDGVSLTVSGLRDCDVSITLVPYTITKTLLARRSAGAGVNIEVDMLGRYVIDYLRQLQGGAIDLGFLKKHGFA